jgi:hypothetical protein
VAHDHPCITRCVARIAVNTLLRRTVQGLRLQHRCASLFGMRWLGDMGLQGDRKGMCAALQCSMAFVCVLYGAVGSFVYVAEVVACLT